MKIALGSKTKLGFISGKCIMPDEDSDCYEQWIKVDCMVISWLLNSISKKLSGAFLCEISAKKLWDDLKQRYGQSNGPMLYQLEREIASISQGNNEISVYFTSCTCGAMKNYNCGLAKSITELNSQTNSFSFRWD
ncbi:uncharacterized protein LOC126661572 [Mercurialis annua]|uniref:uncharacterized protein LOC126661572 n=1 Tax=Mercurialis annua TaxID=3986 RepID=UPI00215E0F1A|nr:uncharacterized protein LOC126661572 [Mercurialis annua]